MERLLMADVYFVWCTTISDFPNQQVGLSPRYVAVDGSDVHMLMNSLISCLSAKFPHDSSSERKLTLLKFHFSTRFIMIVKMSSILPGLDMFVDDLR
jgi:hypothetical protein